MPNGVHSAMPRMGTDCSGIQILVCLVGETVLSSGSGHLMGEAHCCLGNNQSGVGVTALAWESPQSDRRDAMPILREPPVRWGR